MSQYEYFMVDADIVKRVIDSNTDNPNNHNKSINIAIAIFSAIKDKYKNKYQNIQVGIDNNSITINDRVIGYKINTTKHCNLIASDLFYHITQIIADPTIQHVTITKANMFETIKELPANLKNVIDTYTRVGGGDVIGNQVSSVSQPSTQLPQLSSSQTNGNDRGVEQLTPLPAFIPTTSTNVPVNYNDSGEDDGIGNQVPGSPQSTKLPSFIPIEKSPNDKSTQLPSFIPTEQTSSQQTTTQTNNSISQEAQPQNDNALFIGKVCEFMNNDIIQYDAYNGLPIAVKNTCYLNTGMQCLNACPVFVAWVYLEKENSGNQEFVNNVIHIIEVMRGTKNIESESESDDYKNKIIQIQTILKLQRDEQNCSANFVMELIKNISSEQNRTEQKNDIITIVQGNTYLRSNDTYSHNINNILTDFLRFDNNFNVIYPLIVMFNINDFTTYQNGSKLNLDFFKTNDIETLRINNYKYDLVAMSMHSGTADSGHYIAYAKHKDKWWCFDDATVDEIKIENGLLHSLINYTKIGFIPTVFYYSLDYTKICPPLTTMED